MKGVLAAVLLSATSLTAGPSWFVARSSHFEVYATGSPARATDALEMFEHARAFFTAYFSLPESKRAPIRVLVLSGKNEFAPYRTNESDEAFYQPARDRDYIVMKDFNGDSFNVVAHEYVHAALGLKGLDLPPWLAEGMAEFFSSVALAKGKARLGAEPPGRLRALEGARLMKVPELLAVTRHSQAYTASDHASLFYAESWALTHMLMVDPRYRDGASQLIALVQAGADSADALTQVYGKTATEVDRDLWQYVSRAHYAFFTIDFAAPPPAPAAAPPAAVAEFDASLVVADMLAAKIGKDLDARALLDALEREQPDHLGLLETRAFFEQRIGGAAAGDPYFKRAIDHGSQNPAVLAEYALHLGLTDPDRASALLARALTLAPDDPEIRIHSAAILIRLEKPEDAMTTIARITRVPPDLEFEYYQIVANGHAMIGDFDAAAVAAAKVMAAARTPEERRFASSLVATVGRPPDSTKIVDGRIKNLNCDGPVPILEISTTAGALRLAIDDPNKIVIAGGGAGAKLNLDCGEQDAPARVGYSDEKPPDGTSGRVRYLDLRKK